MTVHTPQLPSTTEWLQWGVEGLTELNAGKQSRVVAATLEGQKVAVKLTDRRFADEAVLSARMQAVEALATELSGVVAPLRIRGELIQPIGDWLMTATSFVHGGQLDASAPDDAHLMGRTLATLHEGMAALPAWDLPPVAALAPIRPDTDQSAWQLLHGDFSNQNVIATAEGLRIFDFDDCGYGPVEYDVANSLYMVLFDSEVNGRPGRYQIFRGSFLAGYSHGKRGTTNDATVEEMIATRIGALSRWLDDPSSAPIGIRTSSPEWQETLRSFVRSQDSSGSG